MDENKSSISQAQSYQEMGEFWDTHDVTDYWDQTQPVDFDVNITTETTYYAVESGLSTRLKKIAAKRGVSAETLLNLLLQEKVNELAPIGV